MADFSELIKNFDKIRDFMRDFYIYGFKSREDFSKKSPRTYDNEKRRCESYLGETMKWSYLGSNKVSFVSADCGSIESNPLFSAWKSKSFTDNDIVLHFYILDELRRAEKSAEELTEAITQKSGRIFDLQTVRGKCNEYVELGLLAKNKLGKAFRYRRADPLVEFDDEILDAVKFFQHGYLGVVGRYILDREDAENDLFLFKHDYIAHTLEDGVLYDLLRALRARIAVRITTVGTKRGGTNSVSLIPLRILCGAWSGRRYLCAYVPRLRKFYTFRLDAIKSVAAGDVCAGYGEFEDALLRNMEKVWSVSFCGESRNREGFSLELEIDEEKEPHILRRIEREGRGGRLERVGENRFRFSAEVFDANEAMPWVKTFIGRIRRFEATGFLERKLDGDLRRLAEMYGVGDEANDER